MELSLPLLQSWLPAPEPGFRPGNATISWDNGHLFLRTEFLGGGAGTTATAHGQRLWERGDVAELFLQRAGEPSYREYQVAPNGFTLALHYPDLSCVASVRSGMRRMEEFLSGEIPLAEAWVSDDGWIVSLRLPLEASPGEKFLVSCCRYDHDAAGQPVISSTSPHPVRDFHRPQDWREFVPVAG